VSLSAAQSGLQTAPARRMRWTYHHLFQSSEAIPSRGHLNKISSRDTLYCRKYTKLSKKYNIISIKLIIPGSEPWPEQLSCGTLGTETLFQGQQKPTEYHKKGRHLL
ncbi:MAG: hypothetical protein IJ584_01150, partial [Bacteroidales bacterium]|nr:hypothetical protein [Bacteroidales bacterium]